MSAANEIWVLKRIFCAKGILLVRLLCTIRTMNSRMIVVAREMPVVMHMMPFVDARIHFHDNDKTLFVFIAVNYLDDSSVVKESQDLQFCLKFRLDEVVGETKELGCILIARVLINNSSHDTIGTTVRVKSNR